MHVKGKLDYYVLSSKFKFLFESFRKVVLLFLNRGASPGRYLVDHARGMRREVLCNIIITEDIAYWCHRAQKKLKGFEESRQVI